MEWMTQGPLEPLGVLNKVSRHVEKRLTKYDLGKTVKIEDHLDTFDLHLQTLEVCYDNIACTLFPCTLDGSVAV